MATATEEDKSAAVAAEQAASDAAAEASLAQAKVAGEEAMRIAKINHPNVDWQADPVTGAPLVPGSAEAAVDQTYEAPPKPNADGTYPTEGAAALAKDEEAAAKADAKASKETKKAE